MRSLLCALGFVALAGCQSVNPDARFSCDAGADCGSGYECRPHFSGGGHCFKLGECVDEELCDGADQNCDGRVDETFPEEGRACTTGKQGLCAAGTQGCVVGTLSCLQTVQPAAEQCNGLDDDCDGAVDETFDFTSDEANCGACALRCDGGTTCLSSSCQETRCDDGLDNDLDGTLDCLDQSCLGQVCVSPTAPSWRCGARDGGITVDGGDADGGQVDGGEPDGGASDGGDPDGGADGGLEFGCFAPEQDCANGFDDDGDGEADCLDVDCAGLTCASGTTCTNRSCPGPG